MPNPPGSQSALNPSATCQAAIHQLTPQTPSTYHQVSQSPPSQHSPTHRLPSQPTRSQHGTSVKLHPIEQKNFIKDTFDLQFDRAIPFKQPGYSSTLSSPQNSEADVAAESLVSIPVVFQPGWFKGGVGGVEGEEVEGGGKKDERRLQRCVRYTQNVD
ncbi:UNVERIFIED_CONTAM: hypothetical protein Slati_0903800 [Sesamum latifolium]|uniref:Uncharacterized protein n=1 Tax=Sesamum latifolium TaxID=2727402 RepID=A0AAW2XPJ3_9LAMI